MLWNFKGTLSLISHIAWLQQLMIRTWTPPPALASQQTPLLPHHQACLCSPLTTLAISPAPPMTPTMLIGPAKLTQHSIQSWLRSKVSLDLISKRHRSMSKAARCCIYKSHSRTWSLLTVLFQCSWKSLVSWWHLWVLTIFRPLQESKVLPLSEGGQNPWVLLQLPLKIVSDLTTRRTSSAFLKF